MLGERIDGVGAGEHTRHFPVGDALTLGAVLDPLEILFYLLLVLVLNHALHILRLRSEHHESDAEDGIGTGGEDDEALVAVSQSETHLCSFRAAYPVALCLFERVGEVDGVESVKQTLGIGRDAQRPLTHHALLHRIAAADRQTF